MQAIRETEGDELIVAEVVAGNDERLEHGGEAWIDLLAS
jgi:hypothetical protein